MVHVFESFPALNTVKGCSVKLAAGNLADKVLTILAHLRRIRDNQTRWRQCIQSLGPADTSTLERLVQLMESDPGTPRATATTPRSTATVNLQPGTLSTATKKLGLPIAKECSPGRRPEIVDLWGLGCPGRPGYLHHKLGGFAPHLFGGFPDRPGPPKSPKSAISRSKSHTLKTQV